MARRVSLAVPSAAPAPEPQKGGIVGWLSNKLPLKRRADIPAAPPQRGSDEGRHNELMAQVSRAADEVLYRYRQSRGSVCTHWNSHYSYGDTEDDGETDEAASLAKRAHQTALMAGADVGAALSVDMTGRVRLDLAVFPHAEQPSDRRTERVESVSVQPMQMMAAEHSRENLGSVPERPTLAEEHRESPSDADLALLGKLTLDDLGRLGAQLSREQLMALVRGHLGAQTSEVMQDEGPQDEVMQRASLDEMLGDLPALKATTGKTVHVGRPMGGPQQQGMVGRAFSAHI